MSAPPMARSHWAVAPGRVSVTEDGRTATHACDAAGMLDMALRLMLTAREMESAAMTVAEDQRRISE